MAQSVRTRVQRLPKQEEELRIIINPSENNSPSSRKTNVGGRKRLTDPDYEAPESSTDLRPNSGWLIIRRNLHRIRFMGNTVREGEKPLPDLYIGLQMKRELKRAQDTIKNIDKEENFRVIKKFTLQVDGNRSKTYDTSHVTADDALIYDRLGDEPLALQNLLFYFSKQDVSHGTLFWDFLTEVNRVLNMKRKRTVLVQRLRKLALTLSIIFYVLIGLMLITLIVSVITTATKMDDPEVKWADTNVDDSTPNLATLS